MIKHPILALGIALLMSLVVNGAQAAASSAAELTTDADAALKTLYATHPAAVDLSKTAKGILVFPNIVKAGFIFGAGYGEGVLEEHGKVVGYYNSFSGSWGLQAGAQSYGYAVFLMTQRALDYLNKSEGWEIGADPTVVVVDEGAAKNLTSTTLRKDAYAFIFDQKGLMAGISLEGTKISHIRP